MLNGTVSDLEVALRLYRPDGVLREQSRDGYALPPVSPQMLLEKPSGPAFDLVSQLGPPAPSSGGGAFGLLEAGGQRWRSYVMPIRTGEPILGYVEALSPLGRLDALVARLRLLLTALGLICLIGALAISWLVAGRILKPIAEMTQAADEITRSRTLANRVAVPPYRDELERLARTFNATPHSFGPHGAISTSRLALAVTQTPLGGAGRAWAGAASSRAVAKTPKTRDRAIILTSVTLSKRCLHTTF